MDGEATRCSALITHRPGQPGKREFAYVHHDDMIGLVPDQLRGHLDRAVNMLERLSGRRIDG
jgi:hypothetical protein